MNVRTEPGGSDWEEYIMNEARTDTQETSGTANHTNTGSHTDSTVVTEEYKLSGEAVVSKVKELVREGNIRRITLRNDEGRTLIEIPLTIGVVGAILLPVWAAIGAVAALVANLTLSVERKMDAQEQDMDVQKVSDLS